MTAEAIRNSCRRVLFGVTSYSWLILVSCRVQLQWAVQKAQMGLTPSCVLYAKTFGADRWFNKPARVANVNTNHHIRDIGILPLGS